MKLNVLTRFLIYLLFLTSTLWLLVSIIFNPYKSNEDKPKLSTFDKPYKVTIINEHEVQCVYKTDTVKLYFENSYRISEEKLVFIYKN